MTLIRNGRRGTIPLRRRGGRREAVGVVPFRRSALRAGPYLVSSAPLGSTSLGSTSLTASHHIALTRGFRCQLSVRPFGKLRLAISLQVGQAPLGSTSLTASHHDALQARQAGLCPPWSLRGVEGTNGKRAGYHGLNR